MDIREIQNLIKFVAKSGATEVKLEMDDFKITIKTTEAGAAETTYVQHVPMQAAAPQVAVPQAVAPATPVAVTEAPAADENAKYITIKSPMIGTFYRSASPEKPMFVNVGDEVSTGKVVCIIEAMKLFNEIESEVSGRIVKILVDNASPVEYDQPLFLVEPI